MISVIYYRLKILIYDKMSWLTFAGIFLAMLVISGITANSVVKKQFIPIGIIDLDNSEYSQLVVDRLSKQEGITLHISTLEDAERNVSAGKLEAAFVIKQGFMESIIGGDISRIIEVIRSPSSLTPDLIGEIVSSEVIRLSSNVAAADMVIDEFKDMGMKVDDSKDSILWRQVWQSTDALWEPKPLMTINYKEVSSGQAEDVNTRSPAVLSRSSIAAIYGFLCTFLMYSMLMAGSWLIDEKRNGMLHRVISHPVKLMAYITGNMASIVILNYIMAVLVILPVKAVFKLEGIHMAEDGLMLAAYLICTGFFSIFLASLMKSNIQLHMTVPVITLTASILGGTFVPFTELSKAFKWLVVITPQYWFFEGVMKTYTSGRAVSLLHPAAVLALFSLLLFTGTSMAMKRYFHGRGMEKTM